MNAVKTPEQLNINAEWVNSEHLSHLLPEEHATFSKFSITWRDRHQNTFCLTEGRDIHDNTGCSAPHLCVYDLAEWLAWNWWRLRWEPRPQEAEQEDWGMAHCMGSIGSGYAWPKISISADGEHTVLVAQPETGESPNSYRYSSDVTAVVPSSEFERSVDTFLHSVREKLRAEGVEYTNFDAVYDDLMMERQDPKMARRRKEEALLGKDPDEDIQRTASH